MLTPDLPVLIGKSDTGGSGLIALAGLIVLIIIVRIILSALSGRKK